MLLEEQTDRAAHAAAFSEELQRLQRDHEALVRDEHTARAKRVSAVAQRSMGERKTAEARHRRELAEYESNLQEAAKEHQSLERQWLTRSSRPDDKQRIAQLESDLKEKDEILTRSGPSHLTTLVLSSPICP